MKPSQFQPGDDAEFQRVVQTIDELRGDEATDALLGELGLSRSFGFAGTGLSTDFAGARLAHLAETRLAIGGIGFRVARRTHVTADLGVYGYAMVAAGTVGKMLEIGMQFNRRHANNNGFRIVHAEGFVALQFFVRNLVGAQQRVQLELMMAGVWGYLKQLRPEIAAGELKQVNVSCSAPRHYRQYRKFYGAPVSFAQPEDEFLFDADFLSQPIPKASNVAGEILTGQCERVLGELQQEAGIVDAVRRQLMRSRDGEWVDLECVAERLGLSGRTLRRRLLEHGASFKQVSNEVRMTLAKEYVEQTAMSTEAISDLLGYAQPPAFYRAFKNWHGSSPSELRDVRDRTAN